MHSAGPKPSQEGRPGQQRPVWRCMERSPSALPCALRPVAGAPSVQRPHWRCMNTPKGPAHEAEDSHFHCLSVSAFTLVCGLRLLQHHTELRDKEPSCVLCQLPTSSYMLLGPTQVVCTVSLLRVWCPRMPILIGSCYGSRLQQQAS